MVSDHAKVLLLAIGAFGTITISQTVAAVVANSLALLGDCASMGVDTLTYCGNLYAEVVPCAHSASLSAPSPPPP